VADLKFDLVMRRLARKYSPDQPRVPAGSAEGGQWTDAGGGSGSTDAGSRRELTRISASSAGSGGQGGGEVEGQVGPGDSDLAEIQRRFAAGPKTYQRCLDLCYPLLERFQPPGVDYNKWDFHRCMDACLRSK